MKHFFVLLVFSVSCSSLLAGTPLKKVCFKVDGMTCTLCPITVKLAIKKVKGVERVKTSLEKHEAVVDFDPQITNVSQIKKAIDDVGYEANEKFCRL